MDVGRTNLVQMDILTSGLPVIGKPYQISLNYPKSINKEIWLLQNTGYIPKNLSPWAAPVIIVPKTPTPQILNNNNFT